jgi:Ser/Thr protein kinase RdoA (MazF antagonist)
VSVEAFYALTPERILDAVEVGGRRATGWAFALNSLENRVYEVELEDGSRPVAKFYRPDRWSREALLAEHAFLAELAAEEVPVVTPLDLGGGQTLGELAVGDGAAIHYAAFPKVRGRPPEELGDEELAILGRLVARLHLVGERRPEPARPTLTPESYGAASLRLLLDGPFIPLELVARFAEVGTRIVEACARLWPDGEPIRLHGDCHLGNLLHGGAGWFFVDFDDFLSGPPAQDLWLIAPGRDEEAERQREIVVEAYRGLRRLERGALRLVEPLRALRMLRYDAWIAGRWRDPAFQRAFPDFTEHAWWRRELDELERQLGCVLTTSRESS